MLFKLACGHSRVAIYFRVVPKTLLLTFTCAHDPAANRGRAFLGALAGDVSIFDCRNFDVQNRFDRATVRRCVDDTAAPEWGRNGVRALNRAPLSYAQARCAVLSRHAPLAHAQLRRWYYYGQFFRTALDNNGYIHRWGLCRHPVSRSCWGSNL